MKTLPPQVEEQNLFRFSQGRPSVDITDPDYLRKVVETVPRDGAPFPILPRKDDDAARA